MSLSAVRRRIKTLHEKRYHPPVLLSDADLELKARLEGSFHEFVKWGWPIIEGLSPFVEGWHSQAICEHLEALYRLDINRLIINIPPRLGKSNICSVLYCAWVWTREPHLRFLYSSYAQSLSVRDSVKCRRLVQSREYKALWGDQFHLMGDVNNKLRFDNNKTGYRIASSVGGSNTGEGAHFEISDDPNNVLDSESEVIREEVNNWHDFVMSSRHSGLMHEFRRLVVQQRTHFHDVTGNILSKDDQRWVHLCLPMEFEESRACQTVVLRGFKGIWRDPRQQEGELLWPQGINAKALKLLKDKDFRGSSYRIAGQLQQRPSPAEGGIIKREWFKEWKHTVWPDLTYVLQSWDTAIMDNKDACYSACTTWGVWQDDNGYNNLILLNAWRGKLQYPDLKEMIRRCSEDFMCQSLHGTIKAGRRPDMVLIEKAANGMPLVQDLMRSGIHLVPFNPRLYGFRTGHGRIVDSSKEARATIASSWIEQGFVWIPYTRDSNFKNPHKYAEMFLDSCLHFPGEGADLVDSMSQALIKLMRQNDINYKGQKPDDPVMNWKQEVRQTSRLLEKNSNLYGRV